ncbi:TB2/DP1, HVA22 family [Teladorsagia circumcincta]|uniref:Receptor expression-enhancing protein n=1 Tax=Teladorsagia circumcincta TaxID=45464 RepID=A0A2G9UMU5_TELCI|nr:TB2/DP1, HVA22 family [Teladorsagia circumcincta]
MVAWCYKPHGKATDEQLKKLDDAQVKREYVAYGLIGLTCLYLINGEQAFFVSVFITLTYPAYISIQTVRGKKSGDALNLLLYWIPFGFFALIDATSISDIPTYFLLKTAFLLFLFLPQTKGAVLIFQKVIEPATKAFEAAIVKINNSI